MYSINATAGYRRLLRGPGGAGAALEAITADQQVVPYDWYARAATVQSLPRGRASVPVLSAPVDPWEGAPL